MAATHPGSERRRARWSHGLHYAAQLAAHGVARVALRPWMHAECSLDGPACARDFFARGYRHHVRGADTPPCCRRHLHAVLAEVAASLDAAGLAWFACWGTFLGAVRHGDLIPWDRDADLVVRAADRSRALAALAAVGRPLRPGFGGAPDVVRVQASASNEVGVDIELWREDGPDLVQADGAREVRLSRDDVFPLVRRRFGVLDLPTPRRIDVLRALYGPDCFTQAVRFEQRFGRRHGPVPPGVASGQRSASETPSLPVGTSASMRSLPR